MAIMTAKMCAYLKILARLECHIIAHVITFSPVFPWKITYVQDLDDSQ